MHLSSLLMEYSMNNRLILEISDLKTYFSTPTGVVKAVDGMDLRVHANKNVGVVGESGCGKSVMAYSILRMVKEPPGKILQGQIIFKDV